jgi:hypothetical protein
MVGILYCRIVIVVGGGGGGVLFLFAFVMKR